MFELIDSWLFRD